MKNSSPALRAAAAFDEAFQHPHLAHQTHSLWQKGKGIKCRNCGLQSHLDDADRVILTKGLRKECRGQSQASPTLVQLFGTQTKDSQRTTGHETQPASSTPQRPNTLQHQRSSNSQTRSHLASTLTAPGQTMAHAVPPAHVERRGKNRKGPKKKAQRRTPWSRWTFSDIADLFKPLKHRPKRH